MLVCSARPTGPPGAFAEPLRTWFITAKNTKITKKAYCGSDNAFVIFVPFVVGQRTSNRCLELLTK